MSSNNAHKIFDISSSSRFVSSNSTGVMNVPSDGNSTYSTMDMQYSPYMIASKEIAESEREYAKSEGDDMKSDEILQAYMDKVDRDQRDLKVEIREREERIAQGIKDSEQRMDDRMARIEQMILEQNKSYEAKMDKLTEKVEVSMKEMNSKFENSVTEIKSNKLQIVALVIATVLSVAGVAIAAIQVVQGFLTLVQ